MNRRSLGTTEIRPLRSEDRPWVASVLISAENFRAEETEVALELFDLGVGVGGRAPEDPDYMWLGIVVEAELAGIACYGPTPATDGTYDLYWLAVAKAHQGKGAGKSLIKHVELRVKEAGGRLLVVETSSVESNSGPRSFYSSLGYEIVATIRDYYRPGDDRLILARRAE